MSASGDWNHICSMEAMLLWRNVGQSRAGPGSRLGCCTIQAREGSENTGDRSGRIWGHGAHKSQRRKHSSSQSPSGPACRPGLLSVGVEVENANPRGHSFDPENWITAVGVK